MKKVLKIMLIIFTFLGIFIIKRDKGLLVYTYLFNNQENVTVFK